MEVTAPLPGTIWQLNVEIGDEVKTGDTVFTMEVMKTEVPVHAEVDGMVVEIRASEGDFLDQGSVVVVLR